MNKVTFPRIYFYDQDFVDIYDRTWSLIQQHWVVPEGEKIESEGYYLYPEKEKRFIHQAEAIYSSFFFVYSNRNYSASKSLDYLYARQEENGAIRCSYNFDTKEPIFSQQNPEALGMPLFAWAEFNLYHKTGDKKRAKDVMPILVRYMNWLETKFKAPNGLYKAPLAATGMINSPRKDASYLIDFNSALAINALYMSSLGDILNDKELTFQYKRIYFMLKTRINSKMWNAESGLYHDLNDDEQQIPVKTIAGFWPLLAEIPNEDKAAQMITHLNNPKTFGTEHPFPSLAVDEPEFDERGMGYRGGVFPELNFMLIKGLERYKRWELANECSIRHLYDILDALSPLNRSKPGAFWESYMPNKEGAAQWPEQSNFPRKQYLLTVGLSTISLMIENIIGLEISLPRKTVNWIIPNLEVMGVENLSLKRNLIKILTTKSHRGWEIHMESEKLYYFTIDILGKKKKTLPIPSGNCSMLIDKL